MFDNLRQQSQQPEEGMPVEEVAPAAASRSGGARLQLGTPAFLSGILALSPMQRFILALMLFLNVTVLGCFALLAFERVVLPF